MQSTYQHIFGTHILTDQSMDIDVPKICGPPNYSVVWYGTLLLVGSILRIQLGKRTE